MIDQIEVLLKIVENLKIRNEYQVSLGTESVYIEIRHPYCILHLRIYFDESCLAASAYSDCPFLGGSRLYSDFIIINVADPELLVKLQEYIDHTQKASARAYENSIYALKRNIDNDS